MQSIKSISIPVTTRHKPTHCIVCNDVTREGKPYCKNHIDNIPYIKWLIDSINNMENEISKLKEGTSNKISPSSPAVHDILISLWYSGPRSVAKLSVDIHMDEPVLRIYVNYLSRRGLVTSTLGNRKKNVFISITQDGIKEIKHIQMALEAEAKECTKKKRVSNQA